MKHVPWWDMFLPLVQDYKSGILPLVSEYPLEKLQKVLSYQKPFHSLRENSMHKHALRIWLHFGFCACFKFDSRKFWTFQGECWKWRYWRNLQIGRTKDGIRGRHSIMGRLQISVGLPTGSRFGWQFCRVSKWIVGMFFVLLLVSFSPLQLNLAGKLPRLSFRIHLN